MESSIGRRTFLSMALCSAAASATFGKPVDAQVMIGNAAGPIMPSNFNGLSYESTQLYNPAYLSADNKPLVQAFRQLSKNGVLRLGGSLSNSSHWHSEAGDFLTAEDARIVEKGQSEKWEWKLTDPAVRDHRNGAITPLSLARLRSFCDATGWSVIYGLDCIAGGPERARDEAAHVAAALGPRLLAFQVGNEADFFDRYRKVPGQGIGDFELYYRDYAAFVTAVREAVPHAPFAGPDTAVSMEWVSAFAKRVGHDAVLLSSHFYAMGPGTDPSQNAELLLSGKSRLGEQIAQARKASSEAGGVPFRLTEVNSCFRGGRPGVSDAFASALWCADMMLQTAAAGYAGVNLHGGGDGIYTPIAVTAEGGAELRPIYFGMQFAEYFTGAQFLDCRIDTPANVTAYAAQRGRKRFLALINKGGQDVNVSQNWVTPKRAIHLMAPGIDAKSRVALIKSPTRAIPPLPAYSASLFVG